VLLGGVRKKTQKLTKGVLTKSYLEYHFDTYRNARSNRTWGVRYSDVDFFVFVCLKEDAPKYVFVVPKHRLERLGSGQVKMYPEGDNPGWKEYQDRWDLESFEEVKLHNWFNQSEGVLK